MAWTASQQWLLSSDMGNQAAIINCLNEEAEYKKAAPRAEAIFKMHMANMAER